MCVYCVVFAYKIQNTNEIYFAENKGQPYTLYNTASQNDEIDDFIRTYNIWSLQFVHKESQIFFLLLLFLLWFFFLTLIYCSKKVV